MDTKKRQLQDDYIRGWERSSRIQKQDEKQTNSEIGQQFSSKPPTESVPGNVSTREYSNKLNLEKREETAVLKHCSDNECYISVPRNKLHLKSVEIVEEERITTHIHDIERIDEKSYSIKSKASHRMTREMEASLKQRTNMPSEYITTATIVTSRRLEEIMKIDARRFGNNFKTKDPYRKHTLSEEQSIDDIFLNVVRKQPRRQELPTKPRRSTQLWSIIKNCVGKDISTVTIPVGFSEPISMLQRLAEEFQYSYLLDKAAACSDPLDQLTYVSAFVVSAYSLSGDRLNKPFNPLLGETYELDRRDDLGWRLMSEQVLQTPPTSVQYCESRRWRCWKTFSISSVFRGKYLKVKPSGSSHLCFDCGSLFTWNRIESTIHNILMGKMWLENVGDIEVMDYKNGNKCCLSFLPFDPINKNNQRRVKGVITDNKGEVLRSLDGKWDSYLDAITVRIIENDVEPKITTDIVWKAEGSSPETEVYYNFNLFACQLNEPENLVAPTDSRRRQDMRLMENGSWDEADNLKRKLEQMDRNKRNSVHFEFNPAWFTPSCNPESNLQIYLFTDVYWKAKASGNWNKCCDIFSL